MSDILFVGVREDSKMYSAVATERDWAVGAEVTYVFVGPTVFNLTLDNPCNVLQTK